MEANGVLMQTNFNKDLPKSSGFVKVQQVVSVCGSSLFEIETLSVLLK